MESPTPEANWRERRKKRATEKETKRDREEDWTIGEIKTRRGTQRELTHCGLFDYRIQSTDGVKESGQQYLRIGKIT